MNDFTKEELELICNAVFYYDKDNCFGLFVNKIQSMIDNYCEHTMEIIINDNDVIVSQCPKCGKGYYKSANSIELI